MSKKRQSDRLRFARQVTRRHGATFAEAFLSRAFQSEAPNEAFGASGVITWPPEPENETPAKVRYMNLEDEILERTFAAAQAAIAAAFVAAAKEVIERERPRRPKRKS